MSKNNNYQFSLPFLYNISTNIENDNLKITIKGAWPNLAYQFYRIEKSIENNCININIFGKVRKGIIAALALKEFEKDILISNIKAGDYIIKVYGKEKVIEKNIKIPEKLHSP